ncbi:MAG: Hedgehog/intein hint domain-containing protein [Parcubacteria group bacterium Licking1014_1]|nr:MAG: Hedgehog/intein hint domain-containing protein [Parcubacteria group bacterium Licking1014_1]
MKFIADFHIHSKYSRATSPLTDLENLDRWAKIKGIKILGTGDFTHPEWLKNLKEKLEPAETGLFKLKNSDSLTRFILTSEISCIYSKDNKVRKIHIIVFAPSFEVAEKINTQLGWIGNLKADGRPILGLDAKELAKIVLNASENCLVVPAHCLLPDTYLHSNSGIKKIKDISVGDLVYTHKGRFKKVRQIYNRFYKGPIYNIKPYYFRIGLQTTSEHPFYAIKSYTNCTNMGHSICKKDCAYIKRRNCSHKYFENYKPQWIPAKDLKKGDILIFPRFNDKTKDIKEIKLSEYLDKKEYRLVKEFIRPSRGMRANLISNKIKVDKNFCRLVGYYLAEGYTDYRDSFSFCLHKKEKDYVNDIKKIVAKIFHLSYSREYKRKNRTSIELIFFSKLLAKVFGRIFYSDSIVRRAHTKCLPEWMLNLTIEKQAEILKGWWRGDAGCTSSRELMNQMKIIALRLGIIPSIIKTSKEKFNEKNHKIENRIIEARKDLFQFSGLAFFENKFGLLKESIFQYPRFIPKLNRRHGWIDKKYIYIPVRDIEITNYKGNVYNLKVEDDNSYLSEFAIVHNCWTPWFSVFGSKSGFDSIEECFEDYSKYIYAGETGLSSDPAMNWRLSALDKITLISNSDAHSPQKIGREANVFDTEISYGAIADAIKSKDLQRFLYTIEFFPEEGKYHYDGHRACDLRLAPYESKKYGNICPKCARPLTIGVLNRVEELADRPEGFKPQNAIPFKRLIPLEEIIVESLGVSSVSKEVARLYSNLISNIGNEFKILLEAGSKEIENFSSPEIAEGIIRTREGRVQIEPGYDGVFGKIKIFSKSLSSQKTLF